MRTHLTRLRGALVLLLVGSAFLFLAGSTLERDQHHAPTEPAAVAGETGGETGGETHAHPAAAGGEAGVTILGVDTESLALSIVAVVLSLLLAAAVWTRLWPPVVMLAIAAFGLVFAAGDGRELVHQLDESNTGLATIAAVLLLLHVVIAVLAASAIRSRRAATA